MIRPEIKNSFKDLSFSKEQEGEDTDKKSQYTTVVRITNIDFSNLTAIGETVKEALILAGKFQKGKT